MKPLIPPLLLSLLLTPALVIGAEYNVSPQTPDSISATLEQIRAERKAGKTEPAKIVLSEGEYLVTKPIELTEADSDLEFVGVAGKTVISGGVEIVGWKDAGNGVWEADLPVVDGSPLYTEQLFVNGARAVRSRYPDTGFLKPANVVWTLQGIPQNPPPIDPNVKPGDRQDLVTEILIRPAHLVGLIGKPGELDLLKTVPASELRWAQLVVHHAWDTTRRMIIGYDAQTNAVNTQGEGMQPYNRWNNASQYYLENVRTAFDQPGEWFYDGEAKKIFYRPLPGQTIDSVKIVAPRSGLKHLVTIVGTADTSAKNISFKNISFQYTDTPRRHVYMQVAGLPETVTGAIDKPGPTQFPPSQGAMYTESGIFVKLAQNVTFDSCEFSHFGEYAFWFRLSKDCRVVNSTLTDLGAGGVRIGSPSLAAIPLELCESITVDNCLIAHAGRFHASGTGVFIGNGTKNISVTHCEITDLYYTGISVGCYWGYAGMSTGNQIEFNKIYNIGQGVLSDMGGVYTLGNLTGTRVCNNVIYDVQSYSYGGWGLYTDEGSQGVLMENNLVYNTMDGSFHQHYGKNNVIRNNILVSSRPNPFGNGQPFQVIASRVESHCSFIFEHNIIYWKDGTSLSGKFDRVNADIRSNLWWKAGGPVEFRGKPHEAMVQSGFDIGGIVADPLFVDPDNHDFHLRPGSPAETIGFRPFDYTKAGRREK